MIERKELLRILKTALNEEEGSIPIYMKHLNSAVFWVGLDKQTTAKVKEVFLYLAKASTRHKRIIGRLIASLEKDDRNAC